MKPRHAAALALLGWYLIVPTVAATTRWATPMRRLLRSGGSPLHIEDPSASLTLNGLRAIVSGTSQRKGELRCSVFKTMKIPPFMIRLLDAFEVLDPYQVIFWIIGGGFLTGFICAGVGHWHLGHWVSYLALTILGVWIFPIVVVTAIFFAAVVGEFSVSFGWLYKAVGFLIWTFVLAFFVAVFLVELLGY